MPWPKAEVEHELTRNLSSKNWIVFESWIEVMKSQIGFSLGLVLCQDPPLNSTRCIHVHGRHRLWYQLQVSSSYQYCFKVLLEGSSVEERDGCQLLNDGYQKVSWVGRNWQSQYFPFMLELQLELFGCGQCWHGDLEREIHGWKCLSSPACLHGVK